MSDAALLQTPLHALHVRLGARMVPFAGYAMPVQYKDGLMAEHRQCRASAVLFDVSHMGQIRLVGDDAAAALETLVPVDLVDLAPGRQRYAFFTNSSGGLLDDLMVVRPDTAAAAAGFGTLFLVVNAGCKDADLRHLQTHIGHRCRVVPMPERALLALQGPKAVQALARLNPGVADLIFMSGGPNRSARRSGSRLPSGVGASLQCSMRTVHTPRWPLCSASSRRSIQRHWVAACFRAAVRGEGRRHRAQGAPGHHGADPRKARAHL